MTYRDDPEIAKKYHSTRWKKLRKQKKIMNPTCERCKVNATYIIHHKEWITDKNYEDDSVFYNLDNLESVCLECHNKEHFKKENDDYIFDDNGDVVKRC